MSKSKMFFISVAVFSFAIVSSGCGIDENLDINPSVTVQIPESSDEPAVSDETSVTEAVQVITDTYETEAEMQVTYPVLTEEAKETEKEPEPVTQEQSPVQQSDPPAIQSSNGVEVEPTYINGILIANKTYALPRSYAPGDLTTATAAAFNQLKDAAAEQGLSIWNQSGYRSYEKQEEIYNRNVQRDGQALTDTYSARPGHSEHQTGLALDLNTIDMSFEQTDEFTWVSQNCYKYGFIIRYPKGKESITGYQYEPWHLRYLGVETATDVYNSGLCLEEYLGITSVYAEG